MPRPRNLAQAYGIQEAVSVGLGIIGGWRICQPGSQARRACAPLPIASLHSEPARLIIDEAVTVRLKPGLCFRLGRNLPDYDGPYTREQVLAAIESCHPAVDVLQPRIVGSDDPLSAIADGCGHQQLIYGPPSSAWSEVLGRVPVSVMQGGRRLLSQVAGPAEDVSDLLQWLANEGSRWGGGLMVSQLVTVVLGTEELRIRTDQPAASSLVGSARSLCVSPETGYPPGRCWISTR